MFNKCFGILLMLVLISFLTTPVFGISVQYSAGNGGDRIAGSDHLNLNRGTDLRIAITLGTGETTLSKTASLKALEGENSYTHTLSGADGSTSYSEASSINSKGSLDIALGAQASGQQSDLSQSVTANGDAAVQLSVTNGKDIVAQDAQVVAGLLSAAQTLGSNAGEIATSGDVSIDGTGTLSVNALDKDCSSKYEMSTQDNGGAASESLRGNIAASAGSPKITFGLTKATGDMVNFQSKVSNPQGTLESKNVQAGAILPITKEQSSIVSNTIMSSNWIRQGTYTVESTMEPISDIWTSSDLESKKSVSNSASGSAYSYDVSGTADIGTDYAYIVQHVNNRGGSMTLSQNAVAKANNGEDLQSSNSLTYSGLSSDGWITGSQYAGADMNGAYAVQSLIQTGLLSSLGISTKSQISPSNDYSWVRLNVIGARGMAIDSKTDASNAMYGTAVQHRTEAVATISDYTGSGRAYADKAIADGESVYQNKYLAKSYGEWQQGGYGGYLSAGAKTVKSAVADVEMDTNDDRANAYTYTKDLSTGKTMSGLKTSATERDTTGYTLKFQNHLYSHAYPTNPNNPRLEYYSTGTTGIQGKNVDTNLWRWDEKTAKWTVVKSYYSVNAYTKTFRATDITTTYKWDKFWELTPRVSSIVPPEKVPWGLKMMYNNYNPSLTRTSGGEGIDVAVIDTGVDTLHPDLAFRIEDWCNPAGPGEYGNSRSDGNSHGTHVSGTIAADGGFDGQGIWGMAPKADIQMYQALGASGSGTFDDMAKGIYRATDLGANIISMSCGGAITSYPPVDNALSYAAANGVLVIAAAGNSGNNKEGQLSAPSIIYPAINGNVVAVGAVDKNGGAAQFTSPGYNNNDEAINAGEVMFGAPGVAVTSTVPTYKGWYATWSGTSMATPHVSGAAAKLWADSSLWTTDPLKRYPSASSIESILQSYAVTRGDVTKLWDGSSIPNGAIPDGTGEDAVTGLGVPIFAQGTT